MLARIHAQTNGIKDWRSNMRATSKFARLYGKAYFKAGEVRTEGQISTKPNGALARLKKTSGLFDDTERRVRHYVTKGKSDGTT